jgi:hypothetical protein
MTWAWNQTRKLGKKKTQVRCLNQQSYKLSYFFLFGWAWRVY